MKTRKPDRPKPPGRKNGQPPALAAKAKGGLKSRRLVIPPIMLEGDFPSVPAAPTVGGPGERFALGPVPVPGPVPPAAPVAPAVNELPEAYGTQQLFLTARDPRWLYAHWDLSGAELRKYNRLSADGHLVLRVFRGSPAAAPPTEIHLHPESRNWFVPVPEAGTKYSSALGYYDAARRWVGLAESGTTLTPPDCLSDETSQQFATIPFDTSYEQLLAIVKAALREHAPLAEAVQQLRANGNNVLPAPEQMGRPWTPAQEKALAEIISLDQVKRIWVGSLEVTELVRRQWEKEISSIDSAQLSLPGVLGEATSPFGGGPRQREFRFNVNAELIIYGSTEPDATVVIGDRTIKLRPDGTFSYRFALPDGQYPLPAAAFSADGEEMRRADLLFARSTEYQGEVGAHAQDPRLEPPLVSVVV